MTPPSDKQLNALGWYGLTDNSTKKWGDSAFAKRVMICQESVRYLKGEVVGEQLPVAKAVTAAGRFFSSTTPQDAFNRHIVPILRHSPIPLHFYVECSATPTHHSLLVNSPLKNGLNIYQKELIKRTTLLFKWLNGESVELPKDFATFLVRYCALFTKETMIRWVDWLQEIGEGDRLNKLGLSWYVARHPVKIGESDSLWERSVTIIANNANNPFSDTLSKKLATIFEENEKIRLDCMFYSQNVTLLTYSQPRWEKEIRSFLFSLTISMDVGFAIQTPNDLFDAIISAEEQLPSKSLDEGKKSLAHLLILWQAFEANFTHDQIVDFYHVLRDHTHIETAQKLLQDIIEVLPNKSACDVSFALSLYKLVLTRPNLSIDLKDFSLFLLFVQTDPAPIYNKLTFFLKQEPSLRRAAESHFNTKLKGYLTDQNKLGPLQTLIHFNNKNDLIEKACSRTRILFEIDAKPTTDFFTEFIYYLDEHTEATFKQAEMGSFLSWTNNYARDSLFHKVVAFLETSSENQRTARKHLDQLFAENEAFISVLAPLRSATSFCEKNNQTAQEKVFTMLKTFAFDVRIDIVSNQSFGEITNSSFFLIQQLLDNELSVLSRISEEQRDHVLLSTAGVKKAPQNLRNMNKLIQKIEEILNYPISSDAYFDALLDSERDTPGVVTLLDKLLKVREKLIESGDLITLPAPLVKEHETIMTELVNTLYPIPNWLVSLLTNNIFYATLTNNCQPLSDYIPVAFTPSLRFSIERSQGGHDALTPLSSKTPLGLQFIRHWEIENGYPVLHFTLLCPKGQSSAFIHAPLLLPSSLLEKHPNFVKELAKYADDILDEHASTNADDTCDTICKTLPKEHQAVAKQAVYEFYKTAKIELRKAIWSLSTKTNLKSKSTYITYNNGILEFENRELIGEEVRSITGDVTIKVDNEKEYLVSYRCENSENHQIVTLSMINDKSEPITVKTIYPDPFVLCDFYVTMQLMRLKTLYYQRRMS